MQSATVQTMPTSSASLWTGRIMSALPTLFMIVDGGMKLFNPPPVAESMAQLGYPESTTFGIGLLALICVAVYLIPQTSILGAILLTGYLGGTIATHVRVGSPLFPFVFSIVLGLLFWGGLYLRDERLRALVPLRR